MTEQPAKKATVRDVYEVWLRIYDNWQKMGGTLLQYAAHPDVDPTELLEACRSYQATTASVREIRRKTIAALEAKRSTSYRIQYWIDKVRNQHLN